jgi:hypothetical protein
MKTVKTSRQFRGSPISIRALCGLEDRNLPFSVLDIVSTNDVRHFSGHLSTGDVDCTWEMTIWQNGFWSIKADFHDGGVVAGDFFFAEFLLAGDQGSKGEKLEGSILNVVESRHLSLSKDGSDRFVRENWHKFEASGPTVRLHAAPSVGGLVVGIFKVLDAVPSEVYFAVVVVGSIALGGKRQMKRCPDGTTYLDLPGRDSPCIEIAALPQDPVEA